jgi:ketosteroid isomerase-like protein
MDAVVQLLQNTEWHEAEGAPQGGVYTGSEAILNGVFGPVAEQLADFKATPQEFLSAGEGRVLVVGSYTGRGAGGELNARFAHLWTVIDGKATHFEQFADTALLRQAVGQRTLSGPPL